MRVFSSLPKRVLWAGGLAVVALALYVLGVRCFLLPVLVVANVLWLPMPSIFRSWFSRLVVSVVLLLSLLQVAATVQFLVLPKSGFITMAVLLTLYMPQYLGWRPSAPQKLNVGLLRTMLLA